MPVVESDQPHTERPDIAVHRHDVTHLVDVVGTSPREAAGVIGTQNVERVVVRAGAWRVNELKQCLLINGGGVVARGGQLDSAGQQGHGSGVRPATHGLHERRAPLSVPVSGAHTGMSMGENRI